MQSADSVIQAIERDFEFLRHVRGEPRPLVVRRRLRDRLAWLPGAIRWGCSIVPMLAVWSTYHLFAFIRVPQAQDMRFMLVHTLGVAWVTLVLLRGRGLAPHGRRIDLLQTGASTGVALAAVPLLMGSLYFLGLVCLSLPVLLLFEPEKTFDAIPFILFGFAAIVPIGILATCSQDALRTLRRVRRAPLSLRDMVWLFLGLIPSAYLARIGLYLQSMFTLRLWS